MQKFYFMAESPIGIGLGHDRGAAARQGLAVARQGGCSGPGDSLRLGVSAVLDVLGIAHHSARAGCRRIHRSDQPFPAHHGNRRASDPFESEKQVDCEPPPNDAQGGS